MGHGEQAVGKCESSEYKHEVLSLIFLKFTSHKFEERLQELISEGKEKYLETSHGILCEKNT